MSSNQPKNLTDLIQKMQAGDRAAGDRAFSAVYTEIHKLARRYLRGERDYQTLQPTALISEACLRLLGGPTVIVDRNHFVALAAVAMRRALIDHVRKKRAAKRGGYARSVTLDERSAVSIGDAKVDIIALDEALNELEEKDPVVVKVIELRFFAGLTDMEAADALGISHAMTRRHWTFGRTWLKQRLLTI